MVFGLFNKKIKPTRILICDYEGDQLKLEADSDAGIYKKYYSNVTVKLVKDSNGLLELIKWGEFDAVHILANINSQGNVGGLSAQEIHNACNNSGVKIVFWAASTPSEIYIKHVKPGAFNLVMTLDRRGAFFGSFLDRLLLQMSEGKSMLMAWVKLVPQNPNAPEHTTAPSCIFHAGCGNMIFLP
jgi:hypothetical protein